ncbi:AAA family ATPase [Vacuolonema iberomarrocanum]|uniref:AAA family ATPase n=1 Tax=Vacuolonema iberomarrocanum TaxID=3454632 RepID=UPI001A03C95C|nr:AAA family ATPase [filamentous cyanobacterium LEGE 07170]
MLTKVHLQNFKKFKDVTVELRPFTVLMGENSSGKTTVLQSINLALDRFYVHEFVEASSEGDLTIRDKGIGLPTIPGISIADSRELYYAKKTGGRSKDGGSIITLTDLNDNEYKLQIRLLYGAFNIKCISEQHNLSNNPCLHTKSPLFISGFVGLLSSEERLFPAAMQERLRTGEISLILRNLLLDTHQRNPERFSQLVNRLREDFDFYLGDIGFNENADVNITAKYNDLCESQRMPLDFSASGSGFMQILQIIAPIYRFCPDQSSVVLLDEPDAHLHPNLQTSLANTLRYIQQELDIQIIISTHSTSIIRAAQPTEVVPISSQAEVNTFLANSSDVEEQISLRIDNYDLGKTIISGKLIFFEDSNISLFEAFDKVLGTKCFSGANTVPTLRGRGKDDKIPFQIHNVLQEMVGQDIEIHFIRDGDGLDTEWRDYLTEFAARANVKLHHLQKHEVENYILKPNLFYRALNSKYPSKTPPSEQDIEAKIMEILKNTIQLNKYSFDDNLEDSIYKTAVLLGLSEYRNPQTVKSSAKRMREEYEAYTDLNELLRVGMGKETLREVFAWLNGLGYNLSRKDLIDHLDKTDVNDEVRLILEQLKSRESKEMSVDSLPEMDEANEDNEDDIEAEEDS